MITTGLVQDFDKQIEELFKNYSWAKIKHLFKLFLVLFIAMKEVNSKHSQISRSVINFQGKLPISRSFKCP